MKRVTLAVLALLSAALASSWVHVPAVFARCGPPRLNLSTTKGLADSTVTVMGTYFYLECEDTGGTFRPARNIRVLFRQSDRSVLLTTLDADVTLSFAATVSIPTTATPGAATIVAEADAYVKCDDPGWGCAKPRPLVFEVLDSGRQ